MMNSRPTKKPDKPRGPFKELRGGLSRIVSSKPFTLVLSLMLALFAWGLLVASDGTLTREKTFNNVAVNVTGEASLKTRGMIVMDDIKELVPGVKMTVEVAQANYHRISGSNYNPHFDLTQIEGVGENEIRIGFSSTLYGPVVACEPSTVKVNVERYMTRRVPVVLEFVGETPAGVFLDTYRTDPTMLSVSGPQSLVTSVSRASAVMDLSALSADRMNDRTALVVQLQNAKGEPVVSDKLEITNQTVITDSVVLDTELVPTRMVRIAQEKLVTGEPMEGYELIGVELEKSELLVAADQEVLDAIEFIVVDQPLDIGGAVETVNGYVRIKRLSNIENILPLDVAISAEIREKTIERTLRGVPVSVSGLGAGLEAELSAESVFVQLTGGYAFINGVEKEDIRLFIDVSGLEAGEHKLPVQIRIDNAEAFSCALSEPEIIVTLSETP